MFARQPGILLALSTLANAVAWDPVGAALAPWAPDVYRKVLLHGLCVLLLFITLYVANMVLIRAFGRAELNDRVVAHSQKRILARLDGRPALHVYKDTLDRVAQLTVLIHRITYKIRIWKSNWGFDMGRPKTVEAAVEHLINAEREKTRHSEAAVAALTQTVNQLQEELRSHASALSALKKTLDQAQKLSLADLMKKLADRWRSSAVVSPRSAHAVDDPVYGRIALSPVLSTLLGHPLVQRLSHVKQLSFSYAQFPSATHTRLCHSIGAAKNAELAMIAILERGEFFVTGESKAFRFDDAIVKARREIIETAKLVALLHDVGHGPFGHALDNYIGFLNQATFTAKPDKKFTIEYLRKFIRPTLESVGVDVDRLVAMLSSRRDSVQQVDNLIADIVDSSLDVDRMDYLVRDAHMTGLRMGLTNTLSLIDSMRPVYVPQRNAFTLSYDESALGYIDHFLLSRDSMYSNCYEHPRKKASERLFVRLIKSLKESTDLSLEDLYALTDEEVTTLLLSVESGSELRRNLTSELMSDLDYQVIHEVPLRRKEGMVTAAGRTHVEALLRDPGQAECHAVLGGLLSEAPAVALSTSVRNWLEATLEGSPDQLQVAYIHQPCVWEEAIAAESIGAERSWLIQVVVPAYEMYLPHYTSTTVLTRREGKFKTLPYFEVSKAMKEVLEQINYQRNRIRVMCPAHLGEEDRAGIKAAAVKVLGS
jgi:HD superfamily phosphohydrolase